MLQHLQQALAQAQKIATLLKEEAQWELLEPLIIIRDEHLAAANSAEQPLAAIDIEKVRDILLQLSVLNEELTHAATAHKNDLYQQIKMSNKSKKMSKAYKGL
jgi:hypothetical protein